MLGVFCVFAAAFVVEALIYQHSMKGESLTLAVLLSRDTT